MALRAAIHRADLSVADMDRGVFQQYTLTLARHPSETEGRMMVRLLAFAMYSDHALAFGRGLSTEDEPDLWKRDDTGVIDLWIDVGLPEERDVRKACGRARNVVVLAYGKRRAEVWWESNAAALKRLGNLSVFTLSDQNTEALETLVARSMKLACTIQDGHIWLASDTASVEVTPVVRHTPVTA
jgi:uncharacterized protein YaeQ